MFKTLAFHKQEWSHVTERFEDQETALARRAANVIVIPRQQEFFIVQFKFL